MKYFQLVKKFVTATFVGAGKKREIPHLERTVYWVKKLNPEADEAFLIAAFAHDIERPLGTKEAMQAILDSPEGYSDKEHLERHQEKGAKIIAEFLEKNGVDQELIDRVKMLISKHEVGGNDEQNLLKDADSISFFETNAPDFITHQLPKVGREKVEEKFRWMFDRITSKKAQEIARPMYEKVMGDLEPLV